MSRRRTATDTSPHLEESEPAVGVLTPSGVMLLDDFDRRVVKTLLKLSGSGIGGAPRARKAPARREPAPTPANDAKSPAPPSRDYPTKWGGKLNVFGKYCQAHNVNRMRFAERFDVTPAYISMLTHGNKTTPGFKLVMRILEWTRSEGLPPFGPEDWARVE